MIKIEYDEATDTYDTSASVYEFGVTRREALVSFRDKLEELAIECNDMIRKDADAKEESK